MDHVFVFSKPDHPDFLGIILGKNSKALSWCIVASRVGSPKTVQVSMEEEVQAGSKDERSNEVMIIIVMIVVKLGIGKFSRRWPFGAPTWSKWSITTKVL